MLHTPTSTISPSLRSYYVTTTCAYGSVGAVLPIRSGLVLHHTRSELHKVWRHSGGVRVSTLGIVLMKYCSYHELHVVLHLVAVQRDYYSIHVDVLQYVA